MRWDPFLESFLSSQVSAAPIPVSSSFVPCPSFVASEEFRKTRCQNFDRFDALVDILFRTCACSLAACFCLLKLSKTSNFSNFSNFSVFLRLSGFLRVFFLTFHINAVSDFPSDSLSTRGFFSYFLACTVSFSGKNPICVLVVSPIHGIWAVNSFPLCFEHNFLEFS